MKPKELRMTIDFYKYLFFLNRNNGISIIINLTIFCVSLITLLYNNLNKGVVFSEFNLVVVLLVIYSLFNIGWEIIEKYKEVQNFTGKNKELEMTNKIKLIKDDKVFQLDEINAERRGEWYFENYSPNQVLDNSVILSREMNRHLWDNDFELRIDPKKEKQVEKYILKNREIITPFFQYKYYNSKRNKQFFFNESKLCLGSDINPKRTHVNCFKSNYYNSFLTNEISTSVLKRVEDATIIYDASNFFPCEFKEADKKYYLQPIDKTVMNNHIGVSTLAFTNDNYLVIRKQNANSQQNIKKYVPTGSGSCDWTDIRKKSLLTTIEFAMKRELWEENGGKEITYRIEDIGTTKVLGFFRWLRRGGKPEFVGVTKLNYSLNQLNPDQTELIDTNNIGVADTFYLETVDELPRVIEEIKAIGDISLPLEMCLDALEHYYQERTNELKTLLEL